MAVVNGKKLKLVKGSKPASNISQVICPKCKCDYFIPMMRGQFVKSFAGNKLQMEWPTRQDKGDSMVVACPSCCIMYRVDEEGERHILKGKWKSAK